MSETLPLAANCRAGATVQATKHQGSQSNRCSRVFTVSRRKVSILGEAALGATIVDDWDEPSGESWIGCEGLAMSISAERLHEHVISIEQIKGDIEAELAAITQRVEHLEGLIGTSGTDNSKLEQRLETERFRYPGMLL